EGNHLFVDQHLSHTAELLRQDAIAKIDYCILEAIAITDDGYIIPTTSIGNSLAFAENADNIIIEINLAQSQDLEDVHDLYSLNKQGERAPIPLENISERIGVRGIPVNVKNVRGIVFTEQLDSPSTIISPDEETQVIADHLMDFLRSEIDDGRLTKELAPLQSGIGSVANAVLHGMVDSEFENLEVYSEVLQDAVFDLIEAGKLYMACFSSLIPS